MLSDILQFGQQSSFIALLILQAYDQGFFGEATKIHGFGLGNGFALGQSFFELTVTGRRIQRGISLGHLKAVAGNISRLQAFRILLPYVDADGIHGCSDDFCQLGIFIRVHC